MIVFPAWMLRELPPAELNVILLHEYAHIERRDDWTNLLQKVLRAVLFFHPAIWWIDRRLSLEREMACDDAVVAKTANPRGYAECLVALLEKSCARRGWSMAQAVVGHTRDACVRIQQLLDHNRPSTTRIWKPALGMVSAFSVASLMLVLHAPQFVAFAPNAPSSTYESARISPEPAMFSSAKMIPAGLHTGVTTSSPRLSKHAITQSSATQLAKYPRSAPQAIPAKMKSRTNSISIVRASYYQDEILPAPRVLIFFETEQIFNSNQQIDSNSSMIWSLHVWRIMVIDPAQIRAAQAPAAKTT
jgi:hypothetical protein